MKKIFAAVLMFTTTAAWSVSMNLEGSCSGKLVDESPISLQYYSNFDGCRDSARAAISFHGELGQMITGKRYFTEKSDIYKFGKHKLVFANSTGNTTGKYRYTDHNGDRQTVILQCEVRDYHYEDCE